MLYSPSRNLKFVILASNPERNLLCSAKVARGGFQFPTTNQVHSAQPVPVRTPVQWTQFGVENEQTDDVGSLCVNDPTQSYLLMTLLENKIYSPCTHCPFLISFHFYDILGSGQSTGILSDGKF
mgnify:CR=1 FL=1